MQTPSYHESTDFIGEIEQDYPDVSEFLSVEEMAVICLDAIRDKRKQTQRTISKSNSIPNEVA